MLPVLSIRFVSVLRAKTVPKGHRVQGDHPGQRAFRVGISTETAQVTRKKISTRTATLTRWIASVGRARPVPKVRLDRPESLVGT